MNLDQLEALHTIVEKGSFRAAAESLHRSQPALSASIKNLEEEFSLQLFDRNTYRPTLTEAGAVFLNACRETLQAARYAERVAKELGQNKAEAKLRVAIDPLAPVEVIEILAHECSRPPVPVTLILEQTILQESHATIIAGEVDLAVARSPDTDESIESILIEAVSLRGVVSQKLLQEKHAADKQFLKANPQVLLCEKRFEEPGAEMMPNSLFRGGGAKIFAPDHFTKVRLIGGGLGWGRLSDREIAEDPELVLIDERLCPPIHLELCLLRPRHRALGPVARTIWSTFAQRAQRKAKGKGR